jgi:hypothetical protein
VTRTQREVLARGLEASSRAVAGLFEAHTHAQLAASPSGGSWSAAECIVHLSMTSAATVPSIETAVKELRARGLRRASVSRMDWVGRLVRWSQEPPPRFRFRTGAGFQPLRVEPLSGVLLEFMTWQARLLELVRASEGFDLEAVKITSAFNRRVRYNVYSAFAILEAHERRHLWQAERAVAAAMQNPLIR